MSSLLSLLVLLFSFTFHVHGSADDPSFHVLTIGRFQTPTTCSSPKGHGSDSMKVAHPYGPCSPLGSTNLTVDYREVLRHDEMKVNNLHRRLSNVAPQASPFDSSKASSTLPVQKGTALGSGNYIVTVGLGTPRQTQTVVFDTGSNMCWVQCHPCSRLRCYTQQDSLFKPSNSSSFKKVPCSSPTCKLPSVHVCGTDKSCIYGVLYGDRSSSVGTLSQDTLTLTPTNAIPKFVFGCGQSNQGLFGRTAGVFGLGRKPLSLATQAASAKYGGVFSYCLPRSAGSTGHLTFGRARRKHLQTYSISYTPMLTSRHDETFYALELIGISVGGKLLSIPPSVFSIPEMIIDSGTVITRLPPDAYDALRKAFRKGMTSYQLSPAVSILDTCYDVTGKTMVTIPSVVLHFGGGVKILLAASNTMYQPDGSHVCLAFAGNQADTSVGIIGNQQLKGMEVVHDLRIKRIGFGVGYC